MQVCTGGLHVAAYIPHICGASLTEKAVIFDILVTVAPHTQTFEFVPMEEFLDETHGLDIGVCRRRDDAPNDVFTNNHVVRVFMICERAELVEQLRVGRGRGN